MNPQRWAILGVQFGYPATRQIGAHHGASAEVAELLHTAYREMVNKLNAVSLSNGSLVARGLPHPLAHIPPERLQQILMQQRQRESGQEGLGPTANGPSGLVGPPGTLQPGMQAQPSQQSRLSVPGLPSQLQQPAVSGGGPNLAMGVPGSTTGQYLTPPQVNPSVVARPLPQGMPQPAVNASPVPPPQLDLSRPPNFEAPEAGVVQKMQEKAIEIFRSHLAQSAHTSE